MRPQTKNTNITHRQQKIPRTKTTKKKNKQQQTLLPLPLLLSHSRPLYSSHTTHHPTNNTQPDETQKRVPPSRSCLHKGVIYRTTSVALDTQQHAIKTKQTIKTKTQTIFALQNPLQPRRLKDRKKPLFHQLLQPHMRTQHMRTHEAFPT